MIILTIVLTIPVVYAQLSLGVPADHKLITITITEKGDVHVIHEIKKPRGIVDVETIEGIVSNVTVTDTEGNYVEFGTTGTEGITGITVFSSQDDVIIEYDLEGVLFLEDNLWRWDYFNSETTKIIFPKDVDLLFVNDRPVMLQNAKGITCYGKSHYTLCSASIEYVINEPTKNIQVKWEDKEFIVGMRTLTEISSFNFNQSSRKISFDVNDDNQLITLIIPLELLWGPYEVFHGEEKILNHEFFSNETYSWLSFRPESSGPIEIIGTTVVPEFPVLTPLVVGIALIIALQLKNKLSLH